MLAYVFVAFSTILIGSTIYWYWKYYSAYEKLPGVRGSPPLPFLGNALEVKDPEDVYWVVDDHVQKYGKTIRECMALYFGVLTIQPEMIEKVMSNLNAINKGRLYYFLLKWLGTGLLTSSKDKWKTRRRLLTPAYHFKILDQFIEIFDKNSKILVQKLKAKDHLDEIDIYPLISLCTLDVISEAAMGTSVNAQNNEESEFVKATKEMNRIIVARAVNPLKFFDFTFSFTQDYQKEKQALKVIHNYTMSIIQKKRKSLIEEGQTMELNSENDMGIKKKMKFLDILLLSDIEGEPLSDEDIKEEVNTFMFEGHDTTSAGISFCIYAISKNPDIQTKILNEQREIFGDDPNRAVTHKDLQEMKYLEMVIKEGLRLYPPVPVVTRLLDEDFHYNNWVIKKGTEVALFVFSLHRYPEFFENPLVFDPERFTPENQSKRHPFSYIPFSGGFRNCIGQKFAMLELKSVISKIVRNFEILEVPNYEVQIKSEIVLSSKNGIMIRLKNRVW